MNPLIINLPRSLDRKSTIEERLKPYFDNYQLIEGIDGSMLRQDDYREEVAKELNISSDKLTPLYFMDRKNFQSYTRDESKILNKVGCFLSHLKAIKFAIDNDLTNVLILEDDFTMNENITKVDLNDSLEFITYLGGSVKPPIPPVKNGIFKLEFYDLYGTYGYLIKTKSAMDYILSLLYSGFNEGIGRIKLKKGFNPLEGRLKLMAIDLFYKKFLHANSFYTEHDGCYCLYPAAISHEYLYKSLIDNKYILSYGLKCLSKIK
jgi:GR25 family glycosyltransferase involved in LPS biosynthesis